MKKLPLDWKMEIDVGCWLFFFYVHPYARMGTLRSSDTKAKTEETLPWVTKSEYGMDFFEALEKNRDA